MPALQRKSGLWIIKRRGKSASARRKHRFQIKSRLTLEKKGFVPVNDSTGDCSERGLDRTRLSSLAGRFLFSTFVGGPPLARGLDRRIGQCISWTIQWQRDAIWLLYFTVMLLASEQVVFLFASLQNKEGKLIAIFYNDYWIYKKFKFIDSRCFLTSSFGKLRYP